MTRDMAKALTRAHGIRFIDELNLLLVWNGSCTVNVYDFEMEHEVDCFTFGFRAEGSPSFKEWEEACETWIEDNHILDKDYC